MSDVEILCLELMAFGGLYLFVDMLINSREHKDILSQINEMNDEIHHLRAQIRAQRALIDEAVDQLNDAVGPN